MKKVLSLLSAAVLLLSACTKDYVEESYTFFRPVYKTKDEVRANIKNSNAEPLTAPGKLFTKGNYVFLNDLNKGVHIIDYSNPAAPKNIGFINIPGNIDLAVRGNYLYADCYTDLVTIDITNPANVVLKGFIEGVFPHRAYDGYFRADSSKVITSWVKVDTMVTSRYNNEGGNIFNRRTDVFFSNASGPAKSASPNGMGGSMARFALHNNRMYTVSYDDLKIFNTSNAALPSYIGKVDPGQGDIETIYPYQDKLFIGSQTGMFIYSVANPDNPVKLGSSSHVRSCDPVIAENNYAYVTLKGGSACGGFSNQLEVVDITNLLAPNRVKIYPMTSPTGLAKDGNNLLICDGNNGLVILNATNPLAMFQQSKIENMIPYDVIAANGLALVVAKDGLYFVGYQNPSAPTVLSKMSTAN